MVFAASITLRFFFGGNINYGAESGSRAKSRPIKMHVKRNSVADIAVDAKLFHEHDKREM